MPAPRVSIFASTNYRACFGGRLDRQLPQVRSILVLSRYLGCRDDRRHNQYQRDQVRSIDVCVEWTVSKDGVVDEEYKCSRFLPRPADINSFQQYTSITPSYQLATTTRSQQPTKPTAKLHKMLSFNIIATALVALSSSVSATVRGGQCCQQGLYHCQQEQGDWGCVQLAGPNCVQQTQGCDEECGGSGYAYRKTRCVLTSLFSIRPSLLTKRVMSQLRRLAVCLQLGGRQSVGILLDCHYCCPHMGVGRIWSEVRKPSTRWMREKGRLPKQLSLLFPIVCCFLYRHMYISNQSNLSLFTQKPFPQST